MHDRGRYDKATIHAFLDAAVVCHIAYTIDGRPYCTPTAFWREGEHLYWHGSSASRAIRNQNKGLPVCLTVTHVDALVMARSGFHHSINYRSVMAFGTAHAITDRAEKLRLMDNFIDRIYPGRSKLIRQPNEQELKATTLMGMEIESASGKIRDQARGGRGGGLRSGAGLVGTVSDHPGDRRTVRMRAPVAGADAARGDGGFRTGDAAG